VVSTLEDLAVTLGWKEEDVNRAVTDRFLFETDIRGERVLCYGFNGPLGAKLLSEYLRNIGVSQLFLGEFDLDGGGPTIHALVDATRFCSTPVQKYVLVFVSGAELEAFQTNHSEGFYTANFLGEQPSVKRNKILLWP